MGQIAHFSPQQLVTIKNTVARDTDQIEFDLFMEACRSYGLDPFRKQIHAVVYSKDKPDKRKMTIIVSRDGLRVLASRCGDYRPASEPAQIAYDPDLKGPTNPKGILSATVRLWKQDKQGEWFPVIGEAFWDEFAPLSDVWAPDETGKRRPTGEKTLDASGNWAKMPIVMITKCAESQALRAGWPETFSNLYIEEEMDRLAAQASASQELAEYQRQEREKRIGGKGLMMVFDDTATLEKVPMGQVMDRCLDFLKGAEPVDAHKFRIRNEQPLRDFWAESPHDALELKKAFEAKLKHLAGAA